MIKKELLTFWLVPSVIMSICARTTGGLVRPIHQDSIFGVSLDVLLQILRSLKRLAAKFAPMRFQWHMDSNMRSDMIALDYRYGAIAPGAGQIQVVGALAADVGIADMILQVATMSLAIPDGDCDGLRRVIRGYQPSFHTLPIGKCSCHWCCLTAELLVEAVDVVVTAEVAVVVAVVTAIATVEAVVAERGAVTVAGAVGGGMVAGHDADNLAFVAAVVATAGAVVADAGADAAAGAIVVVAGAAVAVVAVAVVHVAERYRWKGQWQAGLGPALVRKTSL